MKVIIVGIFFAILAGILAEARAVDGNTTDVAVPNAREDSNITLRNIHINLQPIERFLNWIFEEKIVSEVGEQSPRTFARIRWMGKMFNLVMFLLGMLITMSAGGIMMGMWSVKLGMGVMLLNMAVLLIRLLLSGGNGNNGGGGFTAGFNGGGGGLNGGGFINGGGGGNGGFFNGGGGNGFNGNGNGGGMMMLPQGRVNFQIFSSQSPVIATMPTMLMGNLNGNGLGGR
ncbi:keratin, type II cytoskeletal I-like isoform X2 [Phlebotomus papatasi]|uniref:keratin, type II cytoskeletal I-like isoform X2 n=1 Tax=Phlebotomus papatasi TaxID=29031 RepID=UPI0024836E7D|nr:keratin, type II cytoskeletal I-like isoform X2 [Phlebotomus papatasi]XP_055707916.1 keratin, type II cytoskeletal I-like isoform X2 [Phlebotomus papatasi]